MRDKRTGLLVGVLFGAAVLVGCARTPAEPGIATENVTARTEAAAVESEMQMSETQRSESESETPSESQVETMGETDETESAESETESTAETAAGNGYRVTIDPGHSSVIAPGTDPIGPGATEQKAKDSGGTTGVATGTPEYILNLELSFQLRDELERRGYEVLLTKTDNETPMGNVERANVANDSASDVYIRMHGNGSEDSSVQGRMTICQTPDNPYIGHMYEQCRRLSDRILEHMTAAAEMAPGMVWETDNMTGSNWSQVPVTIVEVGYMSNPEEDLRLADSAYQDKIIQGIANGIDAYFSE